MWGTMYEYAEDMLGLAQRGLLTLAEAEAYVEEAQRKQAAGIKPWWGVDEDKDKDPYMPAGSSGGPRWDTTEEGELVDLDEWAGAVVAQAEAETMEPLDEEGLWEQKGWDDWMEEREVEWEDEEAERAERERDEWEDWDAYADRVGLCETCDGAGCGDCAGHEDGDYW